MGVPEARLLEDYETAQCRFDIGVLCEPVSDEGTIIVANCIVNNAPRLLGVRDPRNDAASSDSFIRRAGN